MRADHAHVRGRWRTVLRAICLFVSLAIVVLLLEKTHLGATFGPAWIDAEVRGHGFAGELLFVCAGGMLTAVGMPRQLMSFLGGYAFGLVSGSALAVLGTLTGCAASFYYARLLGRAYVARRFSGRVRRLDRLIAEHPLEMTLLIRLSPVGNNLVTNLLAGVTSVRPSRFFAGSAIGYLPQTVIFALAGSGVNADPLLGSALSVTLFIVSGALGAWLFRRFRQSKSVDLGLASGPTGAPELRA
jgi:uncharacterized membrane protein YdjX (TVP38/TMEM64 family)